MFQGGMDRLLDGHKPGFIHFREEGIIRNEARELPSPADPATLRSVDGSASSELRFQGSAVLTVLWS